MINFLITLGFILFILIYQLAVGAREGFTWANDKQRKNNPIISPQLGMGKGILCYHSWRVIENLSIAGIIITGYFIPSFWNLLFLYVGTSLFGNFALYERVLNYICLDKLFPDKPDFHILNFTIKRTIQQDIVGITVGLMIMIIGLSIK